MLAYQQPRGRANLCILWPTPPPMRPASPGASVHEGDLSNALSAPQEPMDEPCAMSISSDSPAREPGPRDLPQGHESACNEVTLGVDSRVPPVVQTTPMCSEWLRSTVGSTDQDERGEHAEGNSRPAACVGCGAPCLRNEGRCFTCERPLCSLPCARQHEPRCRARGGSVTRPESSMVPCLSDDECILPMSLQMIRQNSMVHDEGLCLPLIMVV